MYRISNMLMAIICTIFFFNLVGCAPTMKDLPKLQQKLTLTDESERIKTVKKIGTIKDAQTQAIYPILADVLKKDTSSLVRAETVRSISNLKITEGNSLIAETLKVDTDTKVRSECPQALFNLMGSLAIDPLITSLKKDQSEEVRAADVKYIGKIGGEKAAGEIKDMLKNDPSSSVREMAASALGEMRDESSIDLLIDTALSDQSQNVQKAAVIAIGAIPGTKSIAFLVDALKKGNLQDAAITAIATNKRGAESREAITVLLDFAQSSDKIDDRILGIFLDSNDKRLNEYFYRYIIYPYSDRDKFESIVSKIKQSGDTSMVARLINTLGSESDFSVQVRIITALGYFRDSSAVPTLLNMLNNRKQYNSCLPTHLIWALDVIGDAGARDTLCNIYCYEADKDIRYKAADALSNHSEWFQYKGGCATIIHGCK